MATRSLHWHARPRTTPRLRSWPRPGGSPQVVGDTQEFVRGHAVRGDRIAVKTDGEPLTIGDVKAFHPQPHLMLGMEEDHGTIFAQGRDAGVPHNSGTPDLVPMRLGQAIVFDIFRASAATFTT